MDRAQARLLTIVGGAPASDGADEVVEALAGAARQAGRAGVTSGEVDGRGQLDHGDVVGVAWLVVVAMAVDVGHAVHTAAADPSDVVDPDPHRPVLADRAEQRAERERAFVYLFIHSFIHSFIIFCFFCFLF